MLRPICFSRDSRALLAMFPPWIVASVASDRPCGFVAFEIVFLNGFTGPCSS